MGFKKNISVILIVVGIAIMALFIVLFLNSVMTKCDPNHILINASIENNYTKTCAYQSSICRQGEEVKNINGAVYCSYKAKGFLPENFSKGLLIIATIVFILSLIGYILYLLLSKDKKNKPIDDDVAIDAWKLWFSKRNNLPVINNKVDETKFRNPRAKFRTSKGSEYYLQFDIDVLDGHHPGIYTVQTSLSNGVEHILNGNADIQQITYLHHKRPKDFPLHTPDSPIERSLERLQEINPEKASELEQQYIEKQIGSGNVGVSEQQSASNTIEQSEQPQIIMPRPVRRPYRRRFF